ncbi:hypothetical protein [Paraburkholderia caballeronis]|uniref:Uncharacterized protein n=1 Tax=Paraburkholderia caballeronis TaxID=416943 RepID=A0A1H7TXX7_9BURK|nr:hypothetical protein [Paraburkholderia caballeronis]PXW23392.1 hypothetical protein C7403_110130 [Paraburkholderia caballeronis]PXW98385.1 hypothetical protein C7407_110130 [Paraburkholderia caballeronis]RAJ95116.1 hypothetical protein C7409_110131 [Paraburkholderia caballeronis]SEC56215.1 hypothetical protein SAMN05445871_2430 [Paraburkholderia caballeronis]SEL89690.1 hypothetical protein SAMN05192542_11720 [Paraburkholderia caballeronis]
MERLALGRPAPINSGAPVSADWKEGFAVLPGFGDAAHYFTRDVPRVCSFDGMLTLITPVTTACGHERFEFRTARLMEPGAFLTCRHCAAARGAKR